MATITDSDADSQPRSASRTAVVEHRSVSEVLSDSGLLGASKRVDGRLDSARPPRPNGWAVGWVAAEMERLQKLGDDWDGHGAIVPTSEALSQAHEFLMALDGSWPRKALRPAVMASTNGGVILEWVAGEVELVLEFDSDARTQVYVKMRGRETEGPAIDHLAQIAETLACLSAIR